MFTFYSVKILLSSGQVKNKISFKDDQQELKDDAILIYIFPCSEVAVFIRIFSVEADKVQTKSLRKWNFRILAINAVKTLAEG